MALGAGMVGMALLAIVLLLAVAFAGSLAWVWRDAERRGQPGFIVAVLVAFLFWPLSLLVWLAMRPKQSGESLRPGTGSLVAVIMLSLVGALVAVLLFVILRFGWTPNMVTGQTPFSKAVALAKRSEATAAVARIAAVYLHYREEHGRPPATLADLGLAPGQLPPHAQFELLPGTAATDIIVREDWGNHGGHGGAIAFGDGSVAWVDSPYKPLRMDVIKTAVEQQYRQQLGEEFIRVGAMTFNAQENRYDLEIFLNINGEFRRVLDLSQIGAREQERRGRDQQRLQQFLTRSARHAVRHDEAQDLSVYAGSLKLTRQHGTYHHACTVDELMERETLVEEEQP